MNALVQSGFRALADPTRREILVMLGNSDMTIGEVAAQFDMTRAAVKKHLGILEQGALIAVHTRGRERINRLEPEGLRPIFDWLGYFDQFWDDRLRDLKSTIENKDI